MALCSSGKPVFAQKSKIFSGSISFLITGDEEGYAINGTKKVVEHFKKRRERIDYLYCGRANESK